MIMNYLEGAFIKRSEYIASEDERIKEHELHAELDSETFYLAMLDLDVNSNKLEAVKLPVKFRDMARAESGIYLASIAIYDCDLNFAGTNIAELKDGYWNNVRQSGIRISTVPVKSGYFRDHGDALEGELQALTTAILLPA
jgi:hypothetical protein